MSEKKLLRKNECLAMIREKLAVCPQCGRPFDAVDGNSHKTTPDPATTRLYLLFSHGEDEECYDHTTLGEFEAWLAAAIEGEKA